MSTYVTLLKFTQKGVEDIKHGPDRLAAAKQRAKSRGGEIKAFYLVMGRFDAVVISEAPNDEAAAAASLGAASLGFVSTETLRAFTEEEYRKLIASL